MCDESRISTHRAPWHQGASKTRAHSGTAGIVICLISRCNAGPSPFLSVPTFRRFRSRFSARSHPYPGSAPGTFLVDLNNISRRYRRICRRFLLGGCNRPPTSRRGACHGPHKWSKIHLLPSTPISPRATLLRGCQNDRLYRLHHRAATRPLGTFAERNI